MSNKEAIIALAHQTGKLCGLLRELINGSEYWFEVATRAINENIINLMIELEKED